MKQVNKSLFAGHLAALVTILIWGNTFISTKVLLADFTPVEILFIRFTIGLAALFIVNPRPLKLTEPKQELLFAASGLTGVTLYYLLENIALTYSSASNIGVIVSLSPFFTALLARRFLGESLKPAFFVGFAAAISGICLISFNGSMTLHLNPLGDLLAVFAAFLWSCYSIITKKIGDYGYNTIQMTRRIFTYGLLFMIPVLFFADFRLGLSRLANPVNLLNILFLGLGACALCFVTWNAAVKLLGAVKTSVYIYIIPVVTVTASSVILKERLTWMSVLGTLLTLAGLFLSESNLGAKASSHKPAKAQAAINSADRR